VIWTQENITEHPLYLAGAAYWRQAVDQGFNLDEDTTDPAPEWDDLSEQERAFVAGELADLMQLLVFAVITERRIQSGEMNLSAGLLEALFSPPDGEI
jgi:hypothetical protein